MAKLADGTLYVQDTSRVQTLFDSRLVYSKGASVLHLLRRVLGDSAFFQSLRAYADDAALRYRNASTADFRNVCETVSGKDLSLFFTQWVYGSGYPSIQYDWSSVTDAEGASVEVHLQQFNTAPEPAFFTMPLDIRFDDGHRDTTVAVMFDTAVHVFHVRLPFTPANVFLDPDGWALIDVRQTPVNVRQDGAAPERFVLGQNYPNPFNGTTLIPFSLAEPSTVTLEMFSLLGERVAVLQPTDRFPAGSHVIRFSPADASRDALPSGVYFYRLAFPNRAPLVRTMLYLR